MSEKDFYTREDESKSGLSRLRELKGKERWNYYVSYYLVKTLIILALLIVATVFIVGVISRKNDINLYAAVMDDHLDDMSVYEMQKEFIEYVNDQEYDLSISFDEYIEEDSYLLDVKLGLGGTDLLIGDDELYQKYDPGFFAEISTLLDDETYMAIEPYFVYETGEDGSLGVYGIDLSGSEKYMSFSPNMAHPILYIPSVSKNIPYTISWLKFIWGM